MMTIVYTGSFFNDWYTHTINIIPSSLDTLTSVMTHENACLQCFSRIITILWIFGSLVLAAGYCGLLKGNMMKPPLTKPINTLNDLLESGLSPEMVGYDEYEAPMLFDKDPLVKSIYDSRIEIEYEMEPKVKKNLKNLGH